MFTLVLTFNRCYFLAFSTSQVYNFHQFW